MHGQVARLREQANSLLVAARTAADLAPELKALQARVAALDGRGPEAAKAKQAAARS